MPTTPKSETIDRDGEARGWSVGRRDLLRLAGLGAAAGTLTLAGCTTASSTPESAARLSLGQEWDKTFPRDDRVNHEKVSYKNRLGITLAADVYTPKEPTFGSRGPALVVGHPFGGVKEQSSGLYAQALAARGFVTVAHDASYNGESGGTPRAIASPEAFVEDFSAGVDYLGLRSDVDRDRIGVLGICGSGGFSLAAAQIDPRMKAAATVSMYDMGSDRREQLGRTQTEAQRRQELVELGAQRWREADGADTEYIMGTPEALTATTPAVGREFYDYYRTPRGQHPRSTTEMSWNSNGALMQFFPFQNLPWVSPRPVLFIHGDAANSLYFSEDAFARAAEPKELYLVPGAGHVDLYDRTELIPWDKLASFYKTHL